MLDAIISPEWEYRYYSFNSNWSPNEMMASMRDASGDHWFIHFTNVGVFLEGFAHRSKMAADLPRLNVLEAVPKIFASSLEEPAFMMEDTTFCLWRESAAEVWSEGQIDLTKVSESDEKNELLGILDGKAQTYQKWAESYFEVELSLSSIDAILQFRPLTQDLVSSLNPDTSLDDLMADVNEIGYPLCM
jgi:hypothetical protein